MNREIKFKLWDEQAKEWHTGRDFLLDLDGDVLFNNGCGGLSKCEYNCRDQIMCEWTGLVDKDGKEIYEGDILGRDRFTDWVVFWQDGGFRIRNVTNYAQDFLITKAECEMRLVKGNIFEHKKLLK